MQYMEDAFNNMIKKYDILSVVMYPDLINRKKFVHDAWNIAKLSENYELKIAISNDKKAKGLS